MEKSSYDDIFINYESLLRKRRRTTTTNNNENENENGNGNDKIRKCKSFMVNDETLKYNIIKKTLSSISNNNGDSERNNSLFYHVNNELEWDHIFDINNKTDEVDFDKMSLFDINDFIQLQKLCLFEFDTLSMYQQQEQQQQQQQITSNAVSRSTSLNTITETGGGEGGSRSSFIINNLFNNSNYYCNNSSINKYNSSNNNYSTHSFNNRNSVNINNNSNHHISKSNLNSMKHKSMPNLNNFEFKSINRKCSSFGNFNSSMPLRNNNNYLKSSMSSIATSPLINVKFMRLNKFNKIKIYIERCIDKVKHIFYIIIERLNSNSSNNCSKSSSTCRYHIAEQQLDQLNKFSKLSNEVIESYDIIDDLASSYIIINNNSTTNE